jgi:hypothetical protein
MGMGPAAGSGNPAEMKSRGVSFFNLLRSSSNPHKELPFTLDQTDEIHTNREGRMGKTNSVFGLGQSASTLRDSAGAIAPKYPRAGIESWNTPVEEARNRAVFQIINERGGVDSLKKYLNTKFPHPYHQYTIVNEIFKTYMEEVNAEHREELTNFYYELSKGILERPDGIKTIKSGIADLTTDAKQQIVHGILHTYVHHDNPNVAILTEFRDELDEKLEEEYDDADLGGANRKTSRKTKSKRKTKRKSNRKTKSKRNAKKKSKRKTKKSRR